MAQHPTDKKVLGIPLSASEYKLAQWTVPGKKVKSNLTPFSLPQGPAICVLHSTRTRCSSEFLLKRIRGYTICLQEGKGCSVYFASENILYQILLCPKGKDFQHSFFRKGYTYVCWLVGGYFWFSIFLSSWV